MIDIQNARVRAHIEAVVREWLGMARSADISVPELPPRLARRLLRVEEYENPHRDQWGCWEYGFCESHSDGTLLVPEIDEWVTARRMELGPKAELAPLWPEGRQFAVCLTHDVDLVGSASTIAQVVRSMRMSLAPGGRPRPRAVRLAAPPVRAARALHGGIARYPRTEHLERCLAIERRHGVTASYFFTVPPSSAASRFDCTYDPADRCLFEGRRSRIRDVMRELAGEGFDVGLHGSYESALRPGVLTRERERLEAETGLEIRTTRQHFLHWDVSTTPKLQEEAGMSADSTVGFNRAIGFRAATSLPFHLFDAETGTGLDVLEVPLTVHDGPLFRGDGLELDLELAQKTARLLIDRIAGAAGVATLLFHPNNLARDEFVELYDWALRYVLEQGAWVTSLRGLDAWWRQRSTSLT